MTTFGLSPIPSSRSSRRWRTAATATSASPRPRGNPAQAAPAQARPGARARDRSREVRQHDGARRVDRTRPQRDIARRSRGLASFFVRIATIRNFRIVALAPTYAERRSSHRPVIRNGRITHVSELATIRSFRMVQRAVPDCFRRPTRAGGSFAAVSRRPGFTPSAWASRTTVLRYTSTVPRSIRESATTEMPTRSASSACDESARSRKRRTLAPR